MADRKTILIVEDDGALRELYRTALSFAGYDAREAGNGYDALRALDREPPDLVVLDLMLPALSGHVVLEEIGAQAYTRRIPVVVVTGMSGIDLHQINVDCVLTKPVSPERLVEAVRKCLASDAQRPQP